MDRLEAMSTFLAVVEDGSLSATARRLKTPLPTVSRKISELESHLRTKLFNRSSRQLVLTDAGSSYLAACKRILADVTEAERTASGEYAAPTGELSVTTPIGIGRTILIPIMVDFLKTYPDIKARLIPSDRPLSLFQEHIDVGVRLGALPDSSLKALSVGTTCRVACASPAYPLCRFFATRCLDVRQGQGDHRGAGVHTALCRQRRSCLCRSSGRHRDYHCPFLPAHYGTGAKSRDDVAR